MIVAVIVLYGYRLFRVERQILIVEHMAEWFETMTKDLNYLL